MLETYKAKIHGDKIERETDAPKISQNDEAFEVLVTILEEDAELKNPRPFGLSKGDLVVPDDFDASLPEEVFASF